MRADQTNGAETGKAGFLLRWVSSGILVGVIAGFVDAVALDRLDYSLNLPPYFGPMTVIQYGLFFGGLGLLSGLLSLLPPLRFSRRSSSAFLAPAAGFLLALGIANRFYLPAEGDPKSVTVSALLLLLAVGSGWLVYRWGQKTRLRSASTGVFVRLALSVLIIAAVFYRSPVGATGDANLPTRAPLAKGSPNLIIILIDTLRNDHVSWTGYERSTTPELDRLVARGTVLTGAVTQAPYTKPASASLLTSLYPTTHGAVETLGLPESVTTLAEIMLDRGYHTIGVSANTYITPVFGFEQGFETLVTLPYATTHKNDLGHLLRRLYRRFGPTPGVYQLEQALVQLEMVFFWPVPPQASELSGRQVIDGFFDWLRQGEEREPFFAYLHFLEPHALYDPPPPFNTLFGEPFEGDPVTNHPSTVGTFAPDRKAQPLPEEEIRNMIDNYDGEIAFLDMEIGRMIDTLEARGLLDRSLFVVVADHGETFYEHGVWGHGHSLYEEELRVPLVFVQPGKIPGGKRISSTVRLVDVLPTALDLLGLAPHPEAQGTSLANLILAGEGESLPAYSEVQWSGKKHDAFRKGKYKLIRSSDGDVWLYDLEADSLELRDRADEEQEVVREMLREMDALVGFLTESSLGRVGEETELDAATIERLRALGYME